jgi:hypothetical protein
MNITANQMLMVSSGLDRLWGICSALAIPADLRVRVIVPLCLLSNETMKKQRGKELEYPNEYTRSWLRTHHAD